MNETDRMARAGNYVRGLMSDLDRERAERDITYDPGFRDAVLNVARRMRLANDTRLGPLHDDRWRTVSTKLASLPQMRGLAPAVTMTHRSKRKLPVAANALPKVAWRARVERLGRRVSSRRAVNAACWVMLLFGLGFIVGFGAHASTLRAPVSMAGTLAP